MLQTALYIFVETIIHFSGFFNEQSSKEQHLFEIEIFCNVFNNTFGQFDASLLTKCIKSFKEKVEW